MRFRAAVLPLDKELEAALFHRLDRKQCCVCGRYFLPGSNRAKGRLSEYMASTGKQYQNHAATIRCWAAEDRKKAAPPTRNRDYSVKEDETV